jgi:hypothetical protein
MGDFSDHPENQKKIRAAHAKEKQQIQQRAATRIALT